MKTVKLPEVCEILDSHRIPITKSKRVSGPYPYYGANGIQDWVSDYIFDDELVLLAEDGGHFDSDKPIAYRVSGRCWVNNHAHILKAKDNILIDYLYLSLRNYDTSGLTNGATRKKLTQKAMREMTVLLRDKSEQLEIVRLFSRIDVGLVKSKQLQEKLDELVKSRFVETFGDPCDVKSGKFPMEEIGSFCELTIGPFGSALHKEDYIDGGHPVINPSHIVSGRIVPNTKLTVGESKFASMKPYHLHKGDVVLGRRGEIGRCAVVTDEGLLCGTGSMILRPKKSLCRSDYLQRVVSFPAFAAALGREAVGVTMKNLNIKIVGNSSVVLPPLSLQQEFADFVTQVDKLKFETQQSIEKLQMLYDSLVQEYFAPEGD